MVRGELDGHGGGVGARARPAGLHVQREDHDRQQGATGKGRERRGRENLQAGPYHFNRNEIVGRCTRFPLQNWERGTDGEGFAGVFVAQSVVAAE